VVSRALLLMLSRVAGSRRDLSRTHVAAAQALLESGRPGQSLSLPYGMTVRRTAEGLHILHQEEPPSPQPIRVGESIRFGQWRVALAAETAPAAMCLSLTADAVLSVSCWHSADRMRLPGSRGSRTVKRLAADLGIAPALRDRLPVLRVDGRPAAIPGIGIDMEFMPGGGEAAVQAIFLKQAEEYHHEK
jgi:tRNA(Ile)-lysidine synthase